MSMVYDDRAVERVARAICMVQGKDPDEMSWGQDPNNIGIPVMMHNWKMYVRQAQVQIISYESITGHLNSMKGSTDERY